MDVFDAAHEVAMMIVMAVVVPEHTPIVDCATAMVDIRETVLHHFLTSAPDLFSQTGATPYTGEIRSFINSFFECPRLA